MNRSVMMAYILLLICVAAWGSVFPLAKEVLDNMSGTALAIWRFVFAIGAIALVLCVSRAKFPAISLQQYGVLFCIGSIGIAGTNVGLFAGLKYTAAINGSLIMALSPLVNSLLDSLLQRTSIKLSQMLSLVVGFAGVVLVISNGDLLALAQLEVNKGDVYTLLSMLCWCIYTLSAKVTARWLSPLYFTLLTMISGCVVLIFFSYQSAYEAPLTQLLNLSVGEFAGVLYIGLFATVFSYLFWNHGNAVLGVQTASLFFNLVPVFAVISSLLFGQEITDIQLIGMLIVLSALAGPMLFKMLL